MGDVGEVPAPPAVGNTTGKGEGGVSNKLRTAMEAMEVVEEAMAEGYEVDLGEDNMEAEGGGARGYPVDTGIHRVPNTGCWSRRHNIC